ncbi:hypothetical protein [Lysobacter capsici]|uniref:hypothetical protein n=1 Tax=Lysobacter capsici TaxID=435897 RepID=UPI00287B6B99|nr:hypothetical protein [Lysobacter capsici]WND78201.1 hypothetical protein RJ610_12830 [Lysobacter capsici]WND83395.1 hypothetical protein RJ609_12840 [Lysobacter capsici]
MGVDAVLLVRRVSASRVTEDWLDALSTGLCRDIGADNFMIERVSNVAESLALAEWDARFRSHPFHSTWLHCGFDDPDYKRELHELMVQDIGDRPGERSRAIQPTLTLYREDDDPPPGSLYDQCGPDIDADPGECLLEVQMFGRYYGEGYERGDPELYAVVADWLEAQIPGCEIWYGGDSGGVHIEPFDRDRRRRLIEYARARGDLRRRWWALVR